ncbi:type IV secretion system protein [Aliivibrio salmonicida]|uniref:type IV secretion system protein n=1 Tax=Aliivibrio salmonicida TaxID=40269 RepID=UPI00406CC87E
MDITVFSYIGGTIDNFTSDFIVSGIGGLIGAISPLIMMGVTLFLMFKGYLQIFGKTDDLARDTVILGIQVITITTLVLNVDNYTFYIIDGVNAWSSGISNAISKNGDNHNIYQTLDSLLMQAVDITVYCLSKVGWTEGYLWFVVGIVILAVIAILTIISAIIIIGTKFLLTILFVIGPLFIAFAIFPITRKFFDSWVTKIVENVLVQIFGVIIITMTIKIISNFIGKNNPMVDGINPIGVMAQIVVVTGILSWVIRQIPNLSGSLAGGFASGSLTFKEAMAPAAAAAAKFLNGAPKGENKPQRDSWADQQANQVTKGNAQASPQQTKGSQAINDKIAEHNRKS